MAYESKFRNTAKGVIGVVKIGLDGKPKGVPVSADDFVWLSEEEQVLTANAPRNDSDNPFTNGSLTLEVRGSEANTARPIGDDQQNLPPAEPAPETSEEVPEGDEVEKIEELKPVGVEEAPEDLETGAAALPEGEPVVGQRAQNEEVADEEEKVTPSAPAAKPPAPKAPVAPKPKAPSE